MEKIEATGSTERIDELNGRGYRIIQDTKGFCFGLDAVLLSAFCIVSNGDQVLDLGTGTGVIPILLEAKTNGGHFTGLELQSEVADMAARSVKLNHIEEKVDIVNGDIRDIKSIFSGSTFDVVTGNPPYKTVSSGLISPNEKKAISRTEVKCTLDDFVGGATYALKPGGRFYMVHRPERMADIYRTFAKYGLGVRYVRYVHPFRDANANLVLIEGIRGAKNNITVLAPMTVYDRDRKSVV